MATSDRPKAPEAVPLDLLPIIQRSGVLGERQFEDLRARVLRGELPHESRELAERLVRDKVLTEYQVGRFLAGKAHGLAVGRYVILDRIGSGSMGRVYKAHHQLMGRNVALKVIAPEISSNERVVARFQREMKLVGRLDHPNVVRAYDADKIGNVLYIVMEYVAGRSLGDYLRSREPLSPLELVGFAAQAAMGLDHAHQQGIVHRDVKPSNLLLTEDRQVKVLDLGLGTLLEADNQATFATADGIAVGTIDYMSPEQATGKEVDGRSDLYSLGCAMYHLLSGQMPFPGKSPIERLSRRIGGQPVPITEVRPDLPPRVVRVLEKLMAARPQDRFQTAAEAAEALEALTRRRPAAPPAPAPAPALSAAAPAAAAEPPDFPGWFRPLVDLVDRSPAGALAALLSALLATFAAGVALGWALL